tara:strand:- start:335 stop:949 length:615 start_codon:yes stop_codon:yes gene_type:complete
MHRFKEDDNDIIKEINQRIILNLQNSGLIKKTDSVLDFGCGTGIWQEKIIKNEIFFNQLYLYDMYEENRKICREKYDGYTILDNLKEINVDVIFINSVIQYIEKKELEELFVDFYSKLNKDGSIIISDIPLHSRVVEFCLNFFKDYKIFKLQAKHATNLSYQKTNFYRHTLQDIDIISKNYFEISKFRNIDVNPSRFSIVLNKI